jgi:hypothetical protein
MYCTYPQLDRKLVSISALTAKNVVVQFEGDHALLRSEGVIVAVNPRVGKLFPWVVKCARDAADDVNESASAALLDTGTLMHARLGHVPLQKMELVMKATDGLPAVTKDELKHDVFDGCACGKTTVSPFSRQSGSEAKTQEPFEIVHSDLMGPFKPKTKGGAQYALTLLEIFSQFTFVFLLKTKAGVYQTFTEFTAFVKNLYGRRIKCLRLDNGGE